MPRATPSRRSPACAAPEAVPDDELAVQVLRQFRQIFNAVRTHFRQVEKGAGLGGAQVWALSLIRAQPGIGVSELATAMDVHQSTASNLVRGLLTRELIRSEQGTRDRRAVKLWVLPAARAILRRVPGPFEGVLPEALQALDEDVLLRLQADLDVLIQQLGPDETSAHTPLAQM